MRVPGSAGGQERNWKSSARTLSNKPLHSRTRTRCFGLSHGLCSVSPMISVQCLVELLECLNGFISHESSVTGSHLFHRFFGSTFLPTSGSRQASSQDRTASVGLSHDTRVCWSLLTTHNKSISAPRRSRTAEQLHGPALGVSPGTHILASRWPPCMCELCCRVMPLHVLRCSFLAGTARTLIFCTHQRSRLTKIAIFNTSFI